MIIKLTTKFLKNTKLYKAINNYRWRERRVKLGTDNPDVVFYVVRRHGQKAGLFSFVLTNIGAIRDAIDSGYIPVIDMMNSLNPMLTETQVGKINAWELFFEQPFGYSLSDISRSSNVILGSINPPDIYPNHLIANNDTEIAYWRKIANKYIKIKPEIVKECENFIIKEMAPNKTLGVLARGTDYIKSKPHGHPIQPNAETLIEDATRIMIEKDLENIYLATEDQNMWESFKKEFGEKVISYQKTRYRLKEGENINDAIDSSSNLYLKSKEYLVSILILSKCNSLLAGATCGSIGALMLSDGYDYYHIYDLGLYS